MLTSSFGRALKGLAAASVLTVALSGCSGGAIADFLASLLGDDLEVPEISVTTTVAEPPTTAPGSSQPGETTPTAPGDTTPGDSTVPSITVPGDALVPLDPAAPGTGGGHGAKPDVPPAEPAGADS